MIRVEELKNNNNFHISKNVLDRINIKKIKKYKVVKTKLKDLKHCVDRNIISLSETGIYQYLKESQDNEKYIEYIKKYSRVDEDHSLNNFKKLQKNFKEYNIKKDAIVVDNYGILIDGRHRSCILLNRYNGNYEIEVVKIYYSGFHIKTILKLIKYIFKKRFN